MRRYLCILFHLLLTFSAGAQIVEDEFLDSLKRVYYTIENEEAKMKLAADISHDENNSDSIEAWGYITIEHAKNLQNPRYEVIGLLSLSVAGYNRSDFVNSLERSFGALSISEYLEDDSLIAYCCQNVGDAYSYLGDLNKADSYYYRGLDLWMVNNDTVPYLYTLYSLTDNLIMQKLFSQADSLLSIGWDMAEKVDNDLRKALILENYAMLYYTQFIYQFSECDLSLLDKTKDYGLRSTELQDYLYRGNIVGLRSLFFEAIYNDYKGARRMQVMDSMRVMNETFKESIDSQEIDEYVDYALNNVCINLLAGDFNTARNMLDSIEPLALGGEYEPGFMIIYSHYYSIQGDYRNSQHWLARFYESINSAISLDKAVSTAQNLAENEYKNNLRLREAEAERNRRIVIYIAIGIFLVLTFIIFEYFRKRRHNMQLNEKNILLESQKEEILQQKEEINSQKDELFDKNAELAHRNKQITDSINYASLIQKAALPRPEDLSALFGKYFLIYRPLNIVAGDFYWASQVGRYSVLVCADCTGHGVPGAFVSMLGVSLLNEVTAIIHDDTSASDILNMLRAKLMRALGQSKRKYDNGAVYSMDGMDLSMVMIDYDTMSLQYAGAYRPLWIWRDGAIIQTKPDKMPIGLYLGPEKDFTNHFIEIREGDVLYMFSDGIPDQFGYTDDTHTTCKHFSTKKLLSLLTEIGGEPLSAQKERIEYELDAWKNGYKQLDDNILIGVRI